MESYHLKRGQVYAPCGQPEPAVARYVRILRPGGKRVRIADAATGRREREVDVNRLHEFPTRHGVERCTGYFLVETREWLWGLTDRALRKYPYTVSSTSLGQDVSRGGFVRLEPEPAVEAVRILVAALEAADWTVEPATTYPDELRVRFQGKNRCPAMYVAPGDGRQYCTRWRGHSDEHQDDLTLHQWQDDASQPPAWWMPGQRPPGTQARTALVRKEQPSSHTGGSSSKSLSPEGIAVCRRSPTRRGRAVSFADCACSGEGGWPTGERTA
uniref:hypothetical protein n=1 Tax=Streptomyces anthocyanicus TaxID=68174 RepID=UPI002F91197B|nr:hypothetical protein OHA15_41290 [Streptomyces anthocyanicus]